ncbi:MAG: hypothetical protein GF331_23125 [Chitinivibrionales bacterium]|nr:hypothetical protein [Chitinivibrionales bacterium]
MTERCMSCIALQLLTTMLLACSSTPTDTNVPSTPNPTPSPTPITIPVPVPQTAYCIRAGATGAQDGSNWDNAFPTVPASLERDAIYYIADGNYGNLALDDAGTDWIWLAKATANDHGADNGWRSEYGDGVATFSSIDIAASNYIIEGQTGGITGTRSGGHGFEVLFDATGVLFLEQVSDIYVRHVLMHSPSLTHRGTAVKGTQGSVENLVFSYNEVHTFEGPHFHAKGWQNVVIENNYFGHNNSTPEWHAEFWSDLGNTNVTFRYNLFEDIEGTAVFAGVNAGDSRDWYIYGNVFYHCTYLLRFFYEQGSSSNKSTASGFRVYNNTIVGPGEGTITIDQGSDNLVQNNLFYNILEPQGYLVLGGAAAYHYNQFNDCDFRVTSLDATNRQDLTGSPFVSYSTAGLTSCDLHLREPTTVQGATLESVYSLDPDGVVRGEDGHWDCGAFEFAP